MILQQAWLNGELCDQALVNDRGLFYGDGFFTTLLCYDQTPLNWVAHWQRLEHSAQRLNFSPLDQTLLIDDIKRALAQCSPLGFSIIKIVITRGIGGRGYASPKPMQLHRLVYLMPLPPGLVVSAQATLACMPQINAVVCQTPASINSQLAGIKHLNRLENVLARDEALDSGADDGVMLNQFGFLVGSTQANLVLIRQVDSQLMAYTPKSNLSGVAGTCLAGLKSLSLGLTWQEQDLTYTDLAQSDAVFVCNAVRGVQAVYELRNAPQEALIRYQTDLIKPIHQAWWSWIKTQREFEQIQPQ